MEQHDVAAAKGWKTVMKPNGTDVERSHYVTGNSQWPPEDHPLYHDDRVVAAVTDHLLDLGWSVFQLYMLSHYESLHSIEVLRRVNVQPHARIISLGCGVAGMERYWQVQRPDVQFTLVNTSAAQLARCRCDGARIQADMRDRFALDFLHGLMDVVVMGYSLHHVDDVPSMLRTARMYLKPGGTLLVLDVCVAGAGAPDDAKRVGLQRFRDLMQYDPLQPHALYQAGLARLDNGLQWHRLPAAVLGTRVCEMLDSDVVMPTLWIGTA